MYHKVETCKQLHVHTSLVVFAKNMVGQIKHVFRREAHPVVICSVGTLILLCAEISDSESVTWCHIHTKSTTIDEIVHIEERTAEARICLDIPAEAVGKDVDATVVAEVILYAEETRQWELGIELVELLDTSARRDPRTLAYAILKL